MSNKKIVCITGPDGSGKSTLINGLLRHFPYSKRIGIWDAAALTRSNLFESKAAIDHYLCELSPLARTFFLTHALQESLKNVASSEANLIFLDSYFYKYYCSELSLGTPTEVIQTIVNYFLKPDLVISLQLDAEACASRKTKFTRYECGLVLNPDKDSFVEFQRKCGENWQLFRNDNWITIDAADRADEILKTTIRNIDILCKST